MVDPKVLTSELEELRDRCLKDGRAVVLYVSLADMVEPAISVVAQDPQALGRAAAELLFRRLDGEAGAAVHRVIPVTLIARGSGEIASAAS